MTFKSRWGTTIAVLLTMGIVWLHIAQDLYVGWMPASHWAVYHEVKPVAEYIMPGATLHMISHTDVHRPVDMEFNDILYCFNNDGDLARFSEQSTSRMSSPPAIDAITPWPYSPTPSYETDCCMESNTKLVFSNGKSKPVKYDGCKEGIFVKVRK